MMALVIVPRKDKDMYGSIKMASEIHMQGEVSSTQLHFNLTLVVLTF